MKKRNLAARLLPCALALALLTACGHTHSAAGGWELNAKEHWQVCECGETVNTGAHTLDESGMCGVCGAEIWDFGEFIGVYTYTAQGDPLRMTDYDADGNITSELRYEYEYDADGNKLLEKSYENDILTGEAAYEAGVLVQYTIYYEDDTKSTSEYDEDGNIVFSGYYDADGSMISESWSEYAYTADGESYEARSTMTDMDGVKYIGEFNELGDQTAWFCYNADGSLKTEKRYEYEYDAEGWLQAKRTYTDGALTQELIYTTVTDEDGWTSYPGTVIDYHADGSKNVTEYDENYELISETVYDAAGNVVE